MSHYDIHVCDVIKYPEMVMARTDLQWQINSALQLVSLNTKISTNSKNNYILQLIWLYTIHNLTTIGRITWKEKSWLNS